jgi:hypothetical protein
MADQVPNATYNYTRPPPRGKELSTLTAMMTSWVVADVVVIPSLE